MAHRVTYHLRKVGEEWVMYREDGGEAFRELSKKKAISRANDLAVNFEHPCVVATHHENGIVELKRFG